MKLDDAILDVVSKCVYLYNNRYRKNYCYDHFSGDIR